MPKIPVFIIYSLLVLGCVLRFYNLTWGDPYYFHPDERNIASAVSILHFPDALNPHFFAYGSLPIFIIYFTGVGINTALMLFHMLSTQITSVSFPLAILISRFYSATFSFLLIFLVYKAGKALRSKETGLFAAFLTLFSTGLLQFAHFGTFELWLSFLSMLLFLYCLSLSKSPNVLLLLKTSLVMAILIAIKISSLVLLPIPLIALFWGLKKRPQKTIRNIVLYNYLFLFCTFLGSVLFTPFLVLDTGSFMSSMQYETTVATGSLPVFYTGEFYDKIPGLFQFIHVYPFLLNPLLTLVFILSFLYLWKLLFTTKDKKIALLMLFFCLLFFSQVVLFVKWTRYLVPTLPFMYLCIGILADVLRTKKYHVFWLTPVACLSVLWGSFFVISSFGEQDTRIQAANWAARHIPHNSFILSEVYDLGITAFNPYFPRIELFNTYDLDNQTTSNLPSKLEQAQYIILPSQRVINVRLENPKHFPHGYQFYHSLVTGKLGYKQVYLSPCDWLCNVVYLGNPLHAFEQTASVFDKPNVTIYKKITPYTKTEYDHIL